MKIIIKHTHTHTSTRIEVKHLKTENMIFIILNYRRHVVKINPRFVSHYFHDENLCVCITVFACFMQEMQ